MEPIAFISDIHGNIDALDAVLQDIEGQGAKEIYCLGDIVGYGGSPAECVKRVRECCIATVLGNHDELTVKGPENYVLSERVAAGIRHARNQLSREQIQWLETLPISLCNSEFTIVHGSLYNPESFNYFTDSIDARLHFENQKTNISFLGHTHVPMFSKESNGTYSLKELKEGCIILDRLSRYAVNVGSVGQPRDDDPRASYCIFDPQESTCTIRRVRYNIENACLRIIESLLPKVNSDRLLIGR